MQSWETDFLRNLKTWRGRGSIATTKGQYGAIGSERFLFTENGYSLKETPVASKEQIEHCQ